MTDDYLFLYIILFFPLISWSILNYIELNNKCYYAIINFLVMFLCVGFRDINLGPDTRGYIDAFEYNANADIYAWTVGNFEWGYVVLNKFLYFCGFPARSILLVVAFFTIYIMVYVFYKYSYSIWMSLYLFVGLGLYGYNFNVIRQSFAAAIVMLAVCLLSKGKRVLFLILVLIAASFHQSVLLFLPLVFIYNIDKKYVLVYLFVCIISAVTIYLWGLEVFDFLIGNSKYISYTGDKWLGKVDFGLGVIKIIFSLALGLVGICIYFKNLCKDKLLIFLSLLVFTAGVIYFLSYNIKIIGRFSYNYFLYTTILIPELLKHIRWRKNIFFIYFFIIFCFVWFSKELVSLQ